MRRKDECTFEEETMDTRELLFGTEINAVRIPNLARRTDTPQSTMYSWKTDPDKIPLGKLRRIVECRGLSDRQIVEMIRRK